jgi:membrane protein
VLLVVIWVTARFGNQQRVKSYIYDEIGSLIGQGAATQIDATVQKLALEQPTVFAAIVGIGGIIFVSTTVFITLQNGLNRVFKVKPKATGRVKVLAMLKNRILSFALILTFAFILLISLTVNALISAFLTNLEIFLGQFSTIMAAIISYVFPLIIISILISLIFRFLPDVRLRWRHCFQGGMLTAFLFETGKYLIGFYIGQSNFTEWYDSASSLMIMMVWVYYASAIFLLGATITYIVALKENGHVTSQDYAVKVEEVEKEKGKQVEGM